MKLVKSLLLGSAAGLVAVAGASAADLGAKKPTAVEYVKTCPTYGACFFVVPGTTNCLKLVGRVRADYIIDNPRVRSNNHNRFRSRGYVGFDHRTATEYGLLRTYMRAFFDVTNATNSTTLEYAFIQFGGFTFGRVTPIYEHGWNQFYMFSGQAHVGYHSDISYTNSIGYTFNAGGGLSVSVALDDSRERRTSLVGAAMPDVTAAIVYDQSWGTLRVAGAMFQIRNVNSTIDTKYGFAVEGGAKINLPMLSRGSNIWASVSYSEGGPSYTGLGNGAIGSFNTTIADAAVVGNSFKLPVGSYTATVTDAVLVGTSVKLAKNYALAGAIQYFVMPTVSVSVGGFYAQHDPNGPRNTVRTAAVIGQVAWNPAPGFLIGLEGAYRNISFSTGAANVALAANGGTSKSDFVGRLRVQRDF
jgi:Porin subfamily